MSPGGLHRACCCIEGPFESSLLAADLVDGKPLWIRVVAAALEYEKLNPTDFHATSSLNPRDGWPMAESSDRLPRFVYLGVSGADYKIYAGKYSAVDPWAYLYLTTETWSGSPALRKPCVLGIAEDDVEYWGVADYGLPDIGSRLLHIFAAPVQDRWFTSSDGLEQSRVSFAPDGVPWFTADSHGTGTNIYPNYWTNYPGYIGFPGEPAVRSGIAFDSGIQHFICAARPTGGGVRVYYCTLNPWVINGYVDVYDEDGSTMACIAVDRQDHRHLAWVNGTSEVWYGVAEGIGTENYVTEQVTSGSTIAHLAMIINQHDWPELAYHVQDNQVEIASRGPSGNWTFLRSNWANGLHATSHKLSLSGPPLYLPVL